MSEHIANSRKEARALGSKFYHGKPCTRHNGSTVRRTSGRRCVICFVESENIIKKRKKERRREITDIPIKSNRYAAPTYKGKTCKRGHDGTRYLSSESCVACRLITDKIRRDNPIVRARSIILDRERAARRKVAGLTRSSTTNRPPWVTPAMDQPYFNERNARRDLGIPSEIDHFYPKKGRGFSGLDVPWNLIVIDKEANGRKGNKHPRDFYGEDFDKMAKLVADTYEEVLKEQTDAQYSVAA